MKRTLFASLAALAAAIVTTGAVTTGARAEKKYGPGVTDSEIRIGNIMPYSGPASAYGAIGRTEEAYFRMVNDRGGVNGRKIKFISYDDAYSPPKAVEQARKLVESDNVLLIFNPLGSASNTAIRKYMNQKKVPHLFLATGASKWNDPKEYPWTMGWQPTYEAEGEIYAQHVLATRPGAKVAILYQNDDFGKDYFNGIMKGFKDKLKPHMILQYEISDPTVDAQITRLAASGADVFINITTPKFAAQSIKKIAELNWKPTHYLTNVSLSVGAVIKPAGVENAQGIISSNYAKDALDSAWADDAGRKRWLEFMDKYLPGEDKSNSNFVYGYSAAQTMEHVLKMAGDNLTRENIMKQAASIKDLELDMLLPGIRINTSATRFAPINQEQLIVFKGETWSRFGDIYGAKNDDAH